MRVLIKNAFIVCPASEFHAQRKDIFIANGVIETVADKISDQADRIIASENLHVSLGWMDVFADFAEPGFEQRETLETGAQAAAAGGFTDVMLLPNTSPAIDSKTIVEFITERSRFLPVKLHPIGAITRNCEGKDLADMYDAHASGAVAFSDGISAVQNPKVLIKGLQYVLPKSAVVIQVPNDTSFSSSGLMNEGVMSTRLGLPGIPGIAEELMIARDIGLHKYSGSRLHITGTSTRKGWAMIAAAKQDGLQLTASATPYHAFFCDEDLEGYDTNLKVKPPLRGREDMVAVREAIINGTADCMASHHNPQPPDNKACEFEYAKPGISCLEAVFPVLNSFTSDLNALILQLTVLPRRIFNCEIPKVQRGEKACLTLFDPDPTYVFTEKMIHSKSRNNPFVGKTVRGRVIGIINKNNVITTSHESS